MQVACGQCVGCRQRRQKDWAVRCVHEDRMHDSPGSFITLTYDKEHLPWDGSISRRTHQLFIKKLRKELGDRKIRYYMCGEYGADEYDQYQKMDGSFGWSRVGPGRPHYHYLIFGYDFSEDRYEWVKDRDHQYYRSPTLERIWDKGFSLIAPITPETAAYTAGYVFKKQTGEERSENHYSRSVIGRDEPVSIEPEFSLMSLKPGIGSKWFDKYGRSDIYDSGDFVVINGQKFATPKFYDKLLEDLDERELTSIKNDRRLKAHSREADQTPSRLEERELLAKIRLSKRKRDVDEL